MQPSTTTIDVLLFAALREQAGWARRTVLLTGSATPLQCWKQLQLGSEQIPTNIRVAINQRFAAADSSLQAGDELAFLPPISGG
ncbi:MAG: molybdopterin converting factor subunit 1 [Synechococcus sp. TMED19]|nr:MAG: molybdopterin converting factor subunit 1 [Synechococcus sp. TMED19]